MRPVSTMSSTTTTDRPVMSRSRSFTIRTRPESGAKWQISKGGGTNPKWRRDGKELFYLGADGKMTAVEVKMGTTFQVGIPRPLFETRAVFYDIGKDGRFLMTVPSGQAASSAPLTAVFNWQAALKKQ